MLLMNVRSYTFPSACKAAQIFKQVNPQRPGAGRRHARHRRAGRDAGRSPSSTTICQGPGEKVIVDLVQDPAAFPRLVQGEGAKVDGRMADDRPHAVAQAGELADAAPVQWHWPLEPECGWGPGPVATILTSRVCPWQCVFCNENSYIPNMGRKPVDQVIDELNYLDRQVRRRLGGDPRLDVLPEPELAARSGSRNTRARPTSAGPTGRPAAPTPCASGPTCSRRWSARPTGTDLDRLRVGQRPHPAPAQQGMHRGRQLLRHRPGQPHRRRPGARGQAAAEVLVEHHAGHPRRDATRTPSRPCACSSG